MSERIAISALTPGMVIVQVTRQNGPVSIRKSGLVTSQTMIQGLQEMGVQEVEIDPAQTVEVDPPRQHRTQTQQLLRGDHDKSVQMNRAVSDQFNRSLFLPSVQSLPSVWQRYRKTLASYALVVMVGLGAGFAAGSGSIWWPSLWQGASSSLVSEPAAPEAANAESTLPDLALLTKNTQAALGQAALKRPAAPLVSEPSPAQAQSQSASSQIADTNADNRPAQQVAQTEPDAASYDGKVLNAPSTPASNDVSQELLNKFNQAIAELDEKPAGDAKANETRVTVSDSLQRVDQLPVRLLTRLPSMKFSAHMYASNPADRWVRVNGLQKGEGDWIGEDVQIESIEAQRVVLRFQGEVFTMAALTDW